MSTPMALEGNDEVLVDEENSEPEPAAEAVLVAPEKRRLYAQPSDPTIKVLYDRRQDGDLILQPEFQRYFVWDVAKSSRLIESVILDVPLPIIYLAEEDDGGVSVIDGQQRLTSFFKFMDGDFALSSLEVRHDLNKKKYADLDRPTQNKVRNATLRTITVQKESDEAFKLDIFKRLNSGAVALNDQELRNCLYGGPYSKLLRELAAKSDFMNLMGLQRPEKRMRDVEFVLRFAAFYHATYLNYRPPMRHFLDQDMQNHKSISESDAEKLRRAFKSSVLLTKSIFAEHAFKRFYKGNDTTRTGQWEPKRFNASLYDIVMWGFTDYDNNQIYAHADSVREALIYLMTDDSDFVDAIELSTSSVKAVRMRFDKWRHALAQVVGSPNTEPRCFSRSLKEDLFQQDPTCAICHQRITSVDDAAVDHIEQYWMGGKTIPENARLAHRYCNWSRPRKEAQPQI